MELFVLLQVLFFKKAKYSLILKFCRHFDKIGLYYARTPPPRRTVNALIIYRVRLSPIVRGSDLEYAGLNVFAEETTDKFTSPTVWTRSLLCQSVEAPLTFHPVTLLSPFMISALAEQHVRGL